MGKLLTITMDSHEAERLIHLARAGLGIAGALGDGPIFSAFQEEIRSARRTSSTQPSNVTNIRNWEKLPNPPGPWDDGPPDGAA